MVFFEKTVAWVSRVFGTIAGWTLVGMMLLTAADVILRAFRRPILGTYEIVSLLGAIVIAFAMPQTTLQEGHVSVEIVFVTTGNDILCQGFVEPPLFNDALNLFIL